MSELGLVEKTSLADIASAIRTKEKSTNTYYPSEMGDAIRALSLEGSDVEVVENPDGGYDLIVDGVTYTVAKQGEVPTWVTL